MRRLGSLVVAMGIGIALAACTGAALAGGQVIRSDDNYALTFELRPDAKAPGKGALVLAFEAKGGWKLSLEAPWKIELTPPPELKLEKTLLKTADLAERGAERARYEVPYEWTGKGPATLPAKFDFILCTDKLCQKKRFEATLALGEL